MQAIVVGGHKYRQVKHRQKSLTCLYECSCSGSDTSLTEELCGDDLSDGTKSPGLATPALTPLPAPAPAPLQHSHAHHGHELGQSFASIKQEPRPLPQQIGLVST